MVIPYHLSSDYSSTMSSKSRGAISRLCFWIFCDFFFFLTNSAFEKFCAYRLLQHGKKSTVRTRHERSTGIRLCCKTSFKIHWQFHILFPFLDLSCTNQNQWDFLFLSLKCRAEPDGSVQYALRTGCESVVILIWGVGKKTHTCILAKMRLSNLS